MIEVGRPDERDKCAPGVVIEKLNREDVEISDANIAGCLGRYRWLRIGRTRTRSVRTMEFKFPRCVVERNTRREDGRTQQRYADTLFTGCAMGHPASDFLARERPTAEDPSTENFRAGRPRFRVK